MPCGITAGKILQFQSLSGVLGVCNASKPKDDANSLTVSIPFRGFRCLQLAFQRLCYCFRYRVSIPFRGFRCLQLWVELRSEHRAVLFQSLSGVLGVCNQSIACVSADACLGFQSLSGVLGVCNEWTQERQRTRCILFQSLSGVLGVCNQEYTNHYRWYFEVSIPFRGFRCLQPIKDPPSDRVVISFQSLSGVLGVCNYIWGSVERLL